MGSDLVNQRHGRGRNPLLAPLEAEVLGRRRLHRDAVDVDAHRLGHRRTHGVDVGTELGTLHRNRAVDIPDFVAPLAEHRRYAAQQNLRVDARIVVRRIGKVQPDVAQRRRTQQRIAQGVYHHIAVRVGDAPLRVGNPYAAQHQRQPFTEDMHVVSVSDSEIRHLSNSFFLRRGCRAATRQPHLRPFRNKDTNLQRNPRGDGPLFHRTARSSAAEPPQSERRNTADGAHIPNFFCNSGKLLLVPYTKDFRRITRF